MEYRFTWFIENYSYCLQKTGEALYSPEFYVHGLEKTVWRVGLHPRGRNIQNRGYISLFLRRSKLDDGPEAISLRCELSLLATKETADFSKEFQYAFRKGYGYGCARIIHMREFLDMRQRATLLPHDTLGVSCKIRFGDGDIHRTGKCIARTIIATEHVSFHHIFHFSRMVRPNINRLYKFGFSEEEGRLKFRIKLADGASYYGKLAVEIASTCTKRILLGCNLFLVGATGTRTKCGGEDNRFDETRRDMSRLLLYQTKWNILRRKEQFCPNDKLTLLYQCSFSLGVKYENIEETIEYPLRSSIK